MIQEHIEQLHTDYGRFALWGVCGAVMLLLLLIHIF